MTKQDPELALESLFADVAQDALARRRRGEPQPEDGLSEEELRRFEALSEPSSEEEDERERQKIIGNVLPLLPKPLPPVVELKPRATERRGKERRFFRPLSYVGLPAFMAAAAAAMLWIWPPWGIEGRSSLQELTAGPTVLAGAQPKIETRLALDGCANLQLEVPQPYKHLSESLRTEAYLVSGDKTVDWKLYLTPTQSGRFMTDRCAPLPTNVTPGSWDLVVLIGYPGRLWWGRKDALRASAGAAEGSHGGILFLRRTLQLQPSVAAPQ